MYLRFVPNGENTVLRMLANMTSGLFSYTEDNAWVTLPPNTPERHYGLGIGEDHGWLGHTGELPGYNTGAY